MSCLWPWLLPLLPPPQPPWRHLRLHLIPLRSMPLRSSPLPSSPLRCSPRPPPSTAAAVGAALAVPAEVRSWAQVGLQGKVHVLHSTLDLQDCRRARQLRTASREVSVINRLVGEDGHADLTDHSRRAAYVATGPALKALADEVRSRSLPCRPCTASAST